MINKILSSFEITKEFELEQKALLASAKDAEAWFTEDERANEDVPLNAEEMADYEEIQKILVSDIGFLQLIESNGRVERGDVWSIWDSGLCILSLCARILNIDISGEDSSDG